MKLSALALGATVVATQMHATSGVPKSCIASSIAGSAVLAAAVAHHGSLSKPPELICVAAGTVGAVGLGYALTSHAQIAKIPFHCKLGTALGLVVMIAGAFVLAKKN